LADSLSPNAGLNSWAAFAATGRTEAILTGQFLLLDDEVNDVLTTALDAGIEVTGLAPLTSFDGPHLRMLDVTGSGKFDELAIAFRKGLDMINRVRREHHSEFIGAARPELSLESSINKDPLDAALSTRGTVIHGAYKAAIGKRTLLNGEAMGREMGFATSISFTGSDERAVASGEFVERREDLQKVLRAMRVKGLNIDSIRNHTLGECPQVVFVQFWAQGKAVELANAIRQVLNVEVGATIMSEGL
jgi:hypothetical protein